MEMAVLGMMLQWSGCESGAPAQGSVTPGGLVVLSGQQGGREVLGLSRRCSCPLDLLGTLLVWTMHQSGVV